MNRTKIKAALEAAAPMGDIVVKGWVRTRRDAKGFSFLELNDGSCLKNIQILVDESIDSFALMPDIGTGAAVSVEGELVPSPGKGQQWEIKARRIELVGGADQETYPLQKKRHSDEFLRTIAHLRSRTNKYGAVFRIRSELSFAIHNYFRDHGFLYVHSPIITGSDCEGAGEMFQVTTLDPTKPMAVPAGPAAVNPLEADFFGQGAYLTVSGQLSAEIFAQSHSDVYTFGPTFRAENSNTPKHAAEFWMVEPEMAFADLGDDMDLAEDFLKSLIRHVMTHCADDLNLFASFVDKELMGTLEHILKEPFVRLSYTEAVTILESAVKTGRSFEFPVGWGKDLQTEHERFLTEEHFGKPVIVYDYPKEIKAFYMRLNDDGRTVAAMDVLVPRIGEIIGGSQREERLDVLVRRLDELSLSMDNYWWYLDLRRFGSTPHAGFGMGFERLLMLLTGVSNIRDVIPFARTPKHLEF